MWLPIPIYERMPQVLLLLGLMLMYSGIYLTFDYTLSYLYSGAGLVCAAWGIWIYSRRVVGRKKAAAQASVPPPAATVAQTEQAQHEQTQHEQTQHEQTQHEHEQPQHEGMNQSTETQS